MWFDLLINTRYFELALTRSGYDLVTAPIPFDAVALGSDEQPAATTTESLVTCENDAGSNDDECPDSRIQKSGSMEMKVRAGPCPYVHQLCSLNTQRLPQFQTLASCHTAGVCFPGWNMPDNCVPIAANARTTLSEGLQPLCCLQKTLSKEIF